MQPSRKLKEGSCIIYHKLPGKVGTTVTSHAGAGVPQGGVRQFCSRPVYFVLFAAIWKHVCLLSVSNTCILTS